MSEALTKKPTLAELKVAARVLLEEDPSLIAARYSLRMQEAKELLDESISSIEEWNQDASGPFGGEVQA